MSLDIATVYNRYGFLGSEYLLWLWWASETSERVIPGIYKDEVIILELGGGIIIENNKPEKPKLKITIKGEDAGKKEAAIAISEGGRIKEVIFNLKIGDKEFSFVVTSDDLSVKALRTPAINITDEPDETEGAVLEKIYLCQLVFDFIDLSFRQFLENRLSEKWIWQTMPKIVTWLSETMGIPGSIAFQQELFNADGSSTVEPIDDDTDGSILEEEQIEGEGV